ncbi:MAG: OB-fold domain-containing protein [Spongiibacteraceae bacterium]|nr:OB-fold domain-containing protein [Spongiibacteraceae bacterium]
MSAPRPLPRLDANNRPFWTGGAEGELRLYRCRDCQAFTHPPRPVCRSCLSENIAAEAVAGTGVVETFTVNYQAWHPKAEVPYVIARIVLDGVPGVYLTSNVINCDPETVDVGDRVKVVFEKHDDIYLPLFERLS